MHITTIKSQSDWLNSMADVKKAFIEEQVANGNAVAIRVSKRRWLWITGRNVDTLFFNQRREYGPLCARDRHRGKIVEVATYHDTCYQIHRGMA